jgi:hypothetical protein
VVHKLKLTFRQLLFGKVKTFCHYHTLKLSFLPPLAVETVAHLCNAKSIIHF